MASWHLAETYEFDRRSVRYGIQDQGEPLDAQITCPALIIWGCEDTWIPVAKGEKLHRLIPNSTLHKIPDAGHLIIEENQKSSFI